MLELLHIENIALIEKADITFRGGLNVLTGETGAGKSIMIDALSTVLGGRTSRELIRTGAESATVTAVFTGTSADGWLSDNGIEADGDGSLFLMRKITAEGKNTCRVNGTPVSVTQLRGLGGLLIDIHGQNDGRKLMDERAHRTYLDAFGGCKPALEAYAAAYDRLQAAAREISALSLDEGEKSRRIDMLTMQIAEIERADLNPEETEVLLARRELLSNASKLTDAVEDAFLSLDGGDDGIGAVALLAEAEAATSAAARHYEALDQLSERLRELQYQAADAVEELRDIRRELDFSPAELDALEERLALLRGLMRKYGGDEAAVLDYYEAAEKELGEIEFSSERLQSLEAEYGRLLEGARAAAAALSERRKAAAALLETRIRRELSDLNMAGVDFKVDFAPVSNELGLLSHGADEVCFLMSANAGEKPGRISQIASGGELSRIMLALKNVLAEDEGADTMVFDEIDTGVSGIAAQRVAEKLSDLSRQRQVLCVTHLPQIAAMADAQFEIRKDEVDGRTFTRVTELDFEGRKREIARLTGGENITPTTLKSAEEQLQASKKYKERRTE